MRKEAVYTVLLNVTLFYGMQTKLATDPRFFQFSAIENGVTQSYNLKVRFPPVILKFFLKELVVFSLLMLKSHKS